MPGQASLDQAEYYAHPQNAFWPIALAHILSEPPRRALFHNRRYDERCKLLLTSPIGLWDVLAQCERKGSLDRKIEKSTEVPNAINDLLGENPEIKAIIFNGKTAEKLFNRHIKLKEHLPTYSLPSTSPAMASFNLEEKFNRWNKVLTKLDQL